MTIDLIVMTTIIFQEILEMFLIQIQTSDDLVNSL